VFAYVCDIFTNMLTSFFHRAKVSKAATNAQSFAETRSYFYICTIK